MNQNELAEVAFEKESGKWQDLDEWNKSPSELEAFESGFKAAFTLLYPLLEKSLEANRLYGLASNWTQEDSGYGMDRNVFKGDDEEFLQGQGYRAGKLARSTIQEIEAAFKEMGNEL